MNLMLAKATAGELSKRELDDIVAKALTSRNLSKAEKEKLRAVKEAAAEGGLKVGAINITSESTICITNMGFPVRIELFE